MGHVSLYYNTGSYNTALGGSALAANTTASSNTAVGYQSLYSNTTGAENTAVGYVSMYSNTTGGYNTAYGRSSLPVNQTGSYNTAVGWGSLNFTTASNNTAVGYQAGYTNTTGSEITALGYHALYANTTGASNIAVGHAAAGSNTTGANNVAMGRQALASNTTASESTAVGYQALYNSTGAANTAFGDRAGYSVTTGNTNTFVGQGAGYSMTTGSKNTILGPYNGNEGGLDIRTSSNNIVLSDGDGDPLMYLQHLGTNQWVLNANGAIVKATGNGRECLSLQQNYGSGTQFFTYHLYNGTPVGSITSTGSSTAYNTSSDHRLKENVVDLTGATTRLKQLEPKRFNFIADADTTVDGFLAHEVQTVVPEAITGTHNEVDDDGNPVYQGIDQSKLVPLLVATIKELEARITALENA
jgi:hypothetical protein